MEQVGICQWLVSKSFFLLAKIQGEDHLGT